MRDLKTLKELVASITDAESLEKLSSKSFKPSLLDYAISQHAPHFYSEQELIQLHVFFKQLSSSFHQRENTDNTPTIIRKRKTQDMPKEETVVPKIKKLRVIVRCTTPPPPKELPIEFKNRIKELSGCDLQFLMHKRLFHSDVKTNNNRLSMPIKEIRADFLTKEEITKLNERENGSNDGRLIGLEVIVLDPCLREYTLPIKMWSMNTNTYNLVKEWNKIVSANKFKEDQELQIWSFRVNNKLHLLLNKL
ncbi:hypothetical protein PHAVU_006G044300 [Phaseolus vulgaris]|uniref:B3 domain-containing protein n=1 Tax=Phaseolus vulgaris TaxID=3885 RepID=V7BKI7_PHAVU|nr:hypothetical protein PHAVU_006G044300g [Phaseolus vulgaris]ESW18477.1 hypothetical protein PHAVU_006G044300g [Phaseolus vulgaris]